MSDTKEAGIKYTGRTKPEDFSDEEQQNNVNRFCDEQKERDPRIKQAKIRGKKFHRSTTDPSDSKDVISVQFYDDKDKKIGSGHMHKDGTGTFR